MRLLEDLAELLFPTRCAGCELPGALLCDACRAALPRIDRAECVPALRRARSAHLTCTECWNREFASRRRWRSASSSGRSSRAVVLHKDAGERRLGGRARRAARRAGRRASGRAGPMRVACVPATRAALRRRGFDHGRALADADRGASSASRSPTRSRASRARATSARSAARRARPTPRDLLGDGRGRRGAIAARRRRLHDRRDARRRSERAARCRRGGGAGRGGRACVVSAGDAGRGASCVLESTTLPPGSVVAGARRPSPW